MASALQIAPAVSGRALDGKEELTVEAERLVGPLRAGGTEDPCKESSDSCWDGAGEDATTLGMLYLERVRRPKSAFGGRWRA